MNTNELENYKILLEDARQTYYNRLSHFSNLSTKAGIVLAFIVALITVGFSWIQNPGIGITWKIGAFIFIGYATYLAIRAMFAKSQFMNIEQGMRNIAAYPRRSTIEWVKFLIGQYNGFIKEVQKSYDERNDMLKQSLYSIGIAIVVYLLSIIF